MPQLKLQHPDKPTTYALFGWDRALHFFASVFEGHRRVSEYDRMHPEYSELLGAAELLARHGFFALDDIGLVQRQLAYMMPDEFEDLSERRCAEVLVGLRWAAG